jgi:precorrin-2 dehydrogenase/sirohydrochlorin ferrochelatase
MPHNYPLMLDVADRLVVIVGGGAVAVRKAKGLIECGASRVRCVSPTFDDAMPITVERIEAKYETMHLDGATLAFAATDDRAVNVAVVRDARARGVLVNRADSSEDGEPGDFATPAKFVDGAVTVTVSAGGNPALAALIRDRIQARWDPRWSCMADAMRTIRPMIARRADLSPTRRQEILRALAGETALTIAAEHGPEALRRYLAEQFAELNDHA